ncbi:hypothetical protein ANCDUO_11636 [Ancylostoma duodenale]|uniref:Uncharacterized protein n=1 Tax=Ancylostoma duodenale TaxID=51022 RepID=A0A0C2GM74_9BILA|nr:hypothetical protein ANCDUO_11636 [Ancylostoma duodenale]
MNIIAVHGHFSFLSEEGEGERIEVEAQMDQRIPLLSMVPMPPIPFKPKPPAWTRIRPSQVDLFSRIAFPSFFIFFHIVYWGFYLNVSI